MKKVKEPRFMKELHKIREGLAEKWEKMTIDELLASLHESGRWLKAQINLSSSKKAHR